MTQFNRNPRLLEQFSPDRPVPPLGGGGNADAGALAGGGGSRGTDAMRTARRQSPLIDLLPKAKVYPFGEHMIAVPFAFKNALSFTNGQSCWYNLGSITTRSEGGDFVVVGVDANILPPDVDGAGFAAITGVTWIPWGAATGQGAALVFGRNLPVGAEGSWVQAPAYVAGVELLANAVGAGFGLRGSRPEGAKRFKLPTGKLSSTPAPNFTAPQWRLGGPVLPFTGSDSFDVALVVGSAYFNVGAWTSGTRYLACDINLETIVVPVSGVAEFLA